MNVDEFKKSLGKYWYESLASIDAAYWPAIGRTIENAGDNDTKLARGLAQKYARILQEVSAINASYVPLVVEAVDAVSYSADASNQLAGEAPRILKKTGSDGFVQIAQATKALGTSMTFTGLLKISPDLIKKHGREYYASITDAVLKAEEKDSFISRPLLEGYADRLQQGDADEFIAVCASVAEVSAKDARTGINLASTSLEFIQKHGIQKYSEMVKLVQDFIPINKEASAEIAYQGAYVFSAAPGPHKDRILQAAKDMAKHDHDAVVPILHKSPRIIETLGIDKYGPFLEILKESWNLAHYLLYSADELLPKVGLDGFKQIAEATQEIPHGLRQARDDLAMQAARIVKVAGIDGYKEVADTLSGLDDQAWFPVIIELASRSGILVETVGTDGFKRVCDTMQNLQPLYPHSTIPEYAKLLKALAQQDRKYPQIMVRAIQETSRTDTNAGFRMISKCKELVHEHDPNNPDNPYLLLIRSINDPSDAQTVKNLIDLDKYKKPFMERCRRFYG